MAYKSKKKREEERLAQLAASNSSSLESLNSPIEPEQVETEVEAQEHAPSGIDFGSLLGRASDNLRSGVTGEPAGGAKKKYKPSYNSQKKNTDEITTLMVSILTLGVSAWKVPADLKPTEDEIDALSLPATRLLLRHVNLSGRITADVVDTIGIIAVISGYYARTSETWKAYYPPKPKSADVPVWRAQYQPEKEPQAYAVNDDGTIDPVREIDPGTADFLDARSRKHGQPDTDNPA